jgi:hypothetical protein
MLVVLYCINLLYSPECNMQIMMFRNSLEQTKDGYRHFGNRVTAIFLRL